MTRLARHPHERRRPSSTLQMTSQNEYVTHDRQRLLLGLCSAGSPATSEATSLNVDYVTHARIHERVRLVLTFPSVFFYVTSGVF